MIINHQILTTWLARGGQAIAVQGQIAAGYMNVGRQARGMSRETGLAEKQMRAFGTTLRYAFAGSVIFGMTSMIGKLNELQQQMGLIAAIAGPSGVNFGTTGLGRLQDEIAVKSVDARTNITDLNNSVINYLSTVQGADPEQLPEIVSAIGIAARLSQTPTEDLTKAVTTLNIAAGRHNNLKTINGLLREWFSLISRAPGGIAAAPQIAQQLGPLASVAQMGRLTPEQLFGFSLGALRFGATPSVALRGTQYFLQSLFKSPSKEGAEMMKKAGLTPALLDKVGGTEFARQYLAYVKSLGARPTRGGVRKFGALADVMPNPEAVAGDEFAPNLRIPGLGAEARAFLSTTLGRIHGIRTALVLLQDPKVLDAFIKSFSDLEKGVGKDAQQLKKAADEYRRQTPLQEAAIALDSLRTSVARDLSGPLGFISGGISRGAQALTKNRTLREDLLVGGGAAVLLYGGLKLGRGLLGKGLVGAAAAQSLADTGAGPKGSIDDPLFVVVLYQLGGGKGIPGLPGGGSGGGGGLPDVIATGGRRLGRFGRFGRFARGVGPAAATIIAYELVSDWLNLGSIPLGGLSLRRIPANFRGIRQGWNRGPNLRGMVARKNFWETETWMAKLHDPNMHVAYPNLTALMGLPQDHFMRTRFKDIISKALDPATNLDRLERDYSRILKNPFKESPQVQEMMRNMNKPFGMFNQSLTAEGELQLNMKFTGPSGKATLKKVAVPVQFRNGKGPVSRGRRKPNRMAPIPVPLPPWITGEDRNR
jgi:hypothetical protein